MLWWINNWLDFLNQNFSWLLLFHRFGHNLSKFLFLRNGDFLWLVNLNSLLLLCLQFFRCLRLCRVLSLFDGRNLLHYLFDLKYGFRGLKQFLTSFCLFGLDLSSNLSLSLSLSSLFFNCNLVFFSFPSFPSLLFCLPWFFFQLRFSLVLHILLRF